MSKIDKKDIEDILKSSKDENKKYLSNVLSIKNISSFDASYIMSKLNLSEEKIKLIKFALRKYDIKKEISACESYNEYLYEVITSLKNMEESDKDLFRELDNCKNNIENFNKITDCILNNSVDLVKNLFSDKSCDNFVFSKIYVDN